jgi:hypothetical protein
MLKKRRMIAALLAIGTLFFTITATAKEGSKVHKPDENITGHGKALLWRNPDDIKSRNLFYGPGGEEHAPHSTYTFEKEDLKGTSPKFHVRDENGVKWRVKMGLEARPEAAASRLIWAVGYSTNQFYYLPELAVEGLPSHLQRGQNFVSPDGIIRRVELRRTVEGEKKIGNWRWRKNPFIRTREFNGLRVMMALLNNWDLKDENNAIYEVDHAGDRLEFYRVSDLGASFGPSGPSWTRATTKDYFRAYSHSRFIHKETSEFVDFYAPARPCLKYFFNPPGLIMRLRLRWIGRHIPRGDARWVGQLLAQLSAEQIRDAFRAAGYNPSEVEAHAQIIEERIRQLNRL